MSPSKRIDEAMQNPFHRLKHYRPGENDAKENHTTEALAACLVFSEDFRAKFLEFLFGGKTNVPDALADASQVEVATQHSTKDSGIVDLLLRTHRFGVVVEIKVGAREDERHNEQLDNYTNWLREEFGERKWALFTLVRNADAKFKHAWARRRVWSDLFEVTEAFIQKYGTSTDKALLRAFCEYLTLEGVVDNMDYSKLVDYGKGWAADKALEGLLRQTKERLELNIDDLETDIEMKVGEAPCFLFGRSSWENIFGTGFNNKVTAWFCTPITEPDCNECEFRLGIQLWSKWHRNDWDYTVKLLPVWLQRFENMDCSIGSYPKRGLWTAWSHKQELKQDSWYCIEFRSPIRVDADKLRNVDGLALELAERVEKYLKAVDELKSVP